MNQIVFLGGMPRSGSTLLINVLGQNPEFKATATSGLSSLLFSSRKTFSKMLEFQTPYNKDEVHARFVASCRAQLNGWAFGYIKDQKSVYLDKDRNWFGEYEFVSQICDKPKFIVPIRDIRGCISSLERLWRSNRIREAAFEGNVPHDTVAQRATYWVSHPPLGNSINQLKDAIQRGNDKHFHFVKMEDLTNPLKKDDIMKGIYQYLYDDDVKGKLYTHNFDDIKQITQENDLLHGNPSLHEIQPKLEPIKEDWNKVLGKDISLDIRNKFDWFYTQFYEDR